MNETFDPQVRALLDRLEPPALSADFAERVLARAEAMAALPPLPPLRKPRLRRRFALVFAAAGLVGVAAAAAVVPADVWRELPVIGAIVEWVDPAPDEPAPVAARSEPEAEAPTLLVPVAEPAALEAEPEVRPADETVEAPSAVEDSPAVLPPRAEAEPSVPQPEPVERLREPLPQPVREIPLERPAPAPTREAAVVERPVAPERIRPADTSETRQQIRERATTTRQATRERTERRERRTSRAN